MTLPKEVAVKSNDKASSRGAEPDPAPRAGVPDLHRPARRSANPKPEAPLTAQQLYPKMFKGLIEPALHALGFDGFRYVNGDYAGRVSAQKSRYNTKDKVDFTIHLGAVYAPTGEGYWHIRLPRLMPGRHRGWWMLETGQPIEPVAQDVLAALHAYGWPAILAAVDSPGYPPDPAIRWARTFPSEPNLAVSQAKPQFAELSGPTHTADPDTDELFTEISGNDPGIRFAAAETIADFAGEDPRTVPALLSLLESDPEEGIRERAALGLAPWAGTGQVRDALQNAASADEDLDVRWAARYAIRLAIRNHNDAS